MYKCKECNEPVLVVPNSAPIKKCSCNSSIIAVMESTVKGVGGIKL